VTIVLARDWLGSCCRYGSPSGRTPPNSAGWPKALPVIVDVGENHGGAAEGHRFQGGWVTPHRPRAAAAKLMLMLCRVEAAPDIGSILHLAPPLLVAPSMVPRKTLLISGRVGDLQPHLLAEHRQPTTGGTTPRGTRS
jgi:hypothetical protein